MAHLLRTSPCILMNKRSTMGRSMKRTARSTGGRTPLMIPRTGLQTHKRWQRQKESRTHFGSLQIQARNLAVVQRVSTLLTNPTKATGTAQMMIKKMVKAHESMVLVLR
jgi:hypothetical protein